MCLVLCSALIGALPPPAAKRVRQHLSSEIAALRETLENYYLHGSSTYNLVAGPRVDPVAFIRLALIKKENINAEKVENNYFLRQSLHGNIDDIMLSKTKLKIEKILEYTCKERKKSKGKKVLVVGAPGIGKTMLALHLCRLWAEDKLLSEYDLVLLVPLRRFSAEDAKSLKVRSLLEMYSCGEQCADEIERSGGEKVLIILEGWDELPPELRNEFTLFSDIINGLKLPKASVIITSRPTLASELYYLVDRRVEVLGFEQQQITSFVCQYFPAETSDSGRDGDGISPAASKIIKLVNRTWEAEAVSPDCCDMSVQGRLKERIQFWREVLKAPSTVLNTIESGYVLPLKSEPTPNIQCNQQSAIVNADFVQQSVLELIKNRCVKRVLEVPYICSPLSVVESSSGKRVMKEEMRLVVERTYIHQLVQI